jgi:EpsI family protein
MRASALVPMTLLGLGVLLVSGVRPQHAMPPRAPMASLERVILGHPSRDVVVSAEERRVAGMSDYVLRNFGPDSLPLFTVYVGYYDRQVQGRTIHSPKNCLPGAGWEITESARVALPGGQPGVTVNRVLLANKGVQALVYYWYQGRGRIESSEYLVKWNLLRDAAAHGRTEEALVRLVVPVGGGSHRGTSRAIRARSVATADSVARLVLPSLWTGVERVLPSPAGS